MNGIKVILWDIDGTLLDFENAEKHAIRTCFADFGLGECSDGMLAEYSVINHGYWKRLERGELSKPQVLEYRFRDFFETRGIDTALAPAFNNAYQFRLGDTVCFNDDSYNIVKSLKGKILQCAVTNGTKTAQKRKLANSGFDLLLDEIFISDEIGAEKPSPVFFDAVWARLGHRAPGEVMIVGDSLTSDMQGGNNAGIICCWYNPAGAANRLGVRIDREISDLRQVPGLCGF